MGVSTVDVADELLATTGIEEAFRQWSVEVLGRRQLPGGITRLTIMGRVVPNTPHVTATVFSDGRLELEPAPPCAGDGEGDGEATPSCPEYWREGVDKLVRIRVWRDEDGLSRVEHTVEGEALAVSEEDGEAEIEAWQQERYDAQIAAVLEVLHARRHEAPSEDLARAVLEAAMGVE